MIKDEPSSYDSKSLNLLESVDNSDDVSQCQECSWRKDEDKHTKLLRDDSHVEDSSVAEKLTSNTESGESDCKSESNA